MMIDMRNIFASCALYSSLVKSHFFRRYCTKEKSAETPLLKQLKALIRTKGPLPVTRYMRECLSNPVAGYYTTQTVFGSRGDFITSPEISQMFGELLGVWCLNEWLKCGTPKPFNIVEFGPGRGTLMADILRVFGQFIDPSEVVNVRFIEMSPKMSAMQEELLCGSEEREVEDKDADGLHYKERRTTKGVPVYWYWRLQDLPAGFSCYIAHEFFDALPIHKFQKTSSGWHEVLVDLDRDGGPHHLKLILSTKATPASKVFIQKSENRSHLEVSPDAGVIMQEISARIVEHGGFALIADYGHEGNKEDTFRGFRSHQLWDPLCEPGCVDLTADVDFSFLKRMMSEDCLSFGPVPQSQFLRDMGIDVRFKRLLSETKTEEDKKLLTSAYKMLTHNDQMGDRFKFLSVHPRVMKPILDQYPPAGFSPLPPS